MPIKRCPECKAELEVPAVVPGGVAACPYCGAEFPVKAAARPARARARPGSKRAPPRRRRDERYREEEEEYGGGRGYRRRTDPLPIILVVGFLVVALGVVGYIFLKKQREEAENRSTVESAVLAEPPATIEFRRLPDHPEGEAIEMPCIFNVGDLVTVQQCDFSGSVSYYAPGNVEGKEVYDYVCTAKMKERQGEKVVAVEDGRSTHEARFDILSYYGLGATTVTGGLRIEARFQVDRWGDLVPGTFAQTSGRSLTPVPEYLGDRGFRVLPRRKVRRWETWGTDTLPDPISSHLTIEGRTFDALFPDKNRVGGWRIEGGRAVKLSDGSWDRSAIYELKLFAVENHGWRPFTFRGQPAQISGSRYWKGHASYLLYKKLLVMLDPLQMHIQIKVKTGDAIHKWSGQATWRYKIFKDP